MCLHYITCGNIPANEIMTVKGSQFMNDTLIQYINLAGITHLSSIPYSKEENGIVEQTGQQRSQSAHPKYMF